MQYATYCCEQSTRFDDGLITDHDDLGIVARSMMQMVDADEFKEDLSARPRIFVFSNGYKHDLSGTMADWN